MTERETDGDQTLHGSLHSLRGEYEEIREIYRTRREEMPEAQVKMNVRKASEKTSIIDVEGELTAFAEYVLILQGAESIKCRGTGDAQSTDS